MSNDYRNQANLTQQQLGLQQAQCGLGGFGYPHVPYQSTQDLSPCDAASLIALAKKRIAEIDEQLAGVPELEAERERLLRIVNTKEPK